MSYSRENLNIASLWKRIFAFIIDVGVVFVVLTLFATVAGLSEYMLGVDDLWVGVATLLVVLLWPILYFSHMHSSPKRATYGKQLMSIQIKHLDSDTLSYGRAFGRELFRFFFFSITYLFALFSGKNQTLHDMVANTVVINKPSSTSNFKPATSPEIKPPVEKPYRPVPDPIVEQPKKSSDAPEKKPMARPSKTQSDIIWIISGFTHGGEAFRLTLTQHELEMGIVIGGRKTDKTTHVVPDDTVSGQHLKLSLKADNLHLEDLGSTNGTYIDDQVIKPHRPIQVGIQSRIQVGGSEIQLSKG